MVTDITGSRTPPGPCDAAQLATRLSFSAQNEKPAHTVVVVVMPYPTGQWTGTQMRDYVRDHLGPELWRSGVGTQIWVGDDNPASLRDFVPLILDDPAAAQYVRGVAIHDYTNDDPSVLEEFRLHYPAMPLHLTERSYYGINGERHKVSGGWQAGIRRLIDFYRNGITSWTYWITFLDSTGEPNTGPLDASCCSVPFSAPAGRLDAYTTNRDHYLYGQISRYVAHGAQRISSDQTDAEVSNIVFRNPDLTMVAVVANGASAARTIKIVTPDGIITDQLPAMTVATYRWANSKSPSDARLGTVRLVNRAYPKQALQATSDTNLHWDDAHDVVASPTGWNNLQQRWSVTSAGGGYYRLTSLASQRAVLHTTGETYPAHSDAWSVASTRAELQWDEQLWRIEPVGSGYYRLINKRRGTALQVAGERYGQYPDVHQTASSPLAWDLAEQQWQLVPS